MTAIFTKTNRFDHFANFPAVFARYQSEVSEGDRATRIRIWNEVAAALSAETVETDSQLLTPLFPSDAGKYFATASGNTFPIKNLLKKYGFTWDANESEWLQGPKSWEVDCLVDAICKLTGADNAAAGHKDQLVIRFRETN